MMKTMKTFLFTLLALLCGVGVRAQDQAMLDSLQTLINQADGALGEKNFRKAVFLYNELISTCQAQDEKTLPAQIGKIVQAHCYYNLACIYSLSDRKEAALNAFQNAVNAGYRDYLWASRDSDLRNIQSETFFRELIRKLEKKYNYVEILKNAGGYTGDEDTASRPEFTYLPANDPRLVALRETLNLDSIAGDGDEISRIKNLCLWLHNTVRHDGSSRNPTEKNTLAMLELCRKENRGVNCRMLATMLNECYLALGFKSRFVTCLPQDENDPDCHVVTIVWSDTLGKWIMADPSFYAFFQDKQGNLLGIQEARERMIEGKPVYVNPEINWNGNPRSQEEHLNYMAKNFYWFSCPAASTYDTETPQEGKSVQYVSLVPSGFTPWNTSLGSFTSCDPDYFWAKPQ